MEIENKYTNISFDMKKPNIYLNKINELNGSVNVLLDEFKQVYIMSKMYPSNQEVQQRYQDMISNFNKLQSELFTISNSIQVDINELNKNLFEINKFINQEKDINQKLKKALGIVESNINSAEEMISDYKQIYNIKYLRNWSLFLSIILCIIGINIVYRKPVV